jgi:hypothetical protein
VPETHATCDDGVLHTEPAAHAGAAVVEAGQYLPDAQASCVEGVLHTEPTAHAAAAVVEAGQ